jgi:hypothetical protein
VQLLDFLLDRGNQSRVADVGVDLDREGFSDDERVSLGVTDIDRDHGATLGHLIADEFWLAPFFLGHTPHFPRDFALTREVHLGYVPGYRVGRRPETLLDGFLSFLLNFFKLHVCFLHSFHRVSRLPMTSIGHAQKFQDFGNTKGGRREIEPYEDDRVIGSPSPIGYSGRGPSEFPDNMSD